MRYHTSQAVLSRGINCQATETTDEDAGSDTGTLRDNEVYCSTTRDGALEGAAEETSWDTISWDTILTR